MDSANYAVKQTFDTIEPVIPRARSMHCFNRVGDLVKNSRRVWDGVKATWVASGALTGEW